MIDVHCNVDCHNRQPCQIWLGILDSDELKLFNEFEPEDNNKLQVLRVQLVLQRSLCIAICSCGSIAH